MLFCKYMKEQQRDSMGQPWAVNHGFDNSFLGSQFYSNLTKFRGGKGSPKDDGIFEWYKEMENNVRSFAPFVLEEHKGDLFSFVNGITPARIISLGSNYALYDSVLNSEAQKLPKDTESAQCFVELFYRATENLVQRKLRM